jgi:tetratricopeptide (TPR) repeat protein
VTYLSQKSLALTAPLLVFLAIVASPSRLAFAQSNAEADAAISKGVELRRQNKDEEALAQFQRAYKISATPRAKAQMGLAEQAIGRWADAERDLDEAMTQASDPWIIRQRAVLTEAMAVIAATWAVSPSRASLPGPSSSWTVSRSGSSRCRNAT